MVPGPNTRLQFRHVAFSLVELLTVMFIITLLIGILIPSLNSARNSAKKTSTRATLQALKVGLDLFKNENERDFPKTNGYPPSYEHPPIAKEGGYAFSPMDGDEGLFPFQATGHATFKKKFFGAHWLPAMLMGADNQGYIKRSAVPKTNKLHEMPEKWYDEMALGADVKIERAPLYVDPGGIKTVLTERIIGKPNQALFPHWADMKSMPVIVDAFDQPILYYAANAFGKPTNMVAKKRDPTNSYNGGVQEKGPPFYFHQDNQPFTGDEDLPGWDFGGGTVHGLHAIQHAGHDLDADALSAPYDEDLKPGDAGYRAPTFARFILDRAQLRTFDKLREDMKPVDPNTPLTPANAKSYLLISAGVDARYGTADDVTNFPLSTE